MGQLIAVDFHCKYQQVTWLDRRTGEIGEADLRHDNRQAEKPPGGRPVSS